MKGCCGSAHATRDLSVLSGSCGANGKCTGYLGDACKVDNDCQAFFFCGTDGMCGGTAAPCANGMASAPIPLPDQQCVSQSCDTASQKCAAIPSAGIPNGYPCSNSDICASGELRDESVQSGFIAALHSADARFAS